MFFLLSARFQCRKEFVKCHGCDGGSAVAHGKERNELVAKEQGTAALDDIGHVAFALSAFCTEQGGTGACDHFFVLVNQLVSLSR